MKIGILAYPYFNFPPDKYGPIQLLVSEMAKALVSRGHEVTIFATKDSIISCNKITIEPVNDPKELARQTIHKLMANCQNFDLLFLHLSYDTDILAVCHQLSCPVVVELHGNYINPRNKKNFYPFKNDAYFISISDSQRKFLPQLNYYQTIYHGLKISEFEYSQSASDNLAFLGRTSPVKGLDTAIEIAQRTNHLLVIGARQDTNPVAKEFYQKMIKPQLNQKNIVWLGERNQFEKAELLKNAKALLFPIRWDEPFGLVMIEAMACGTPVIAFDRGSVSEVIQNGKTGFICPPDDTNAMIDMVKKIDQMSKEKYQQMRKNCRTHIKKNFTIDRMVDDYEKTFIKITQKQP